MNGSVAKTQAGSAQGGINAGSNANPLTTGTRQCPQPHRQTRRSQLDTFAWEQGTTRGDYYALERRYPGMGIFLFSLFSRC